MKLRSRLTGAALVGTLAVFGLAACGGDDDTSNNDSDSSSQSDEPTDEATEDSSEGDGDKPAKEDVVAGYASFLNETVGGQLPEDMVNQLLTCIVDNIYDDISAESAQALADSNATAISPEDAQTLASATGTCTQELAPQ